MPNNNPNGYNAFGGPNEREPAYGDLKKLEGLRHLAPTSQPTAVGAPKRAQRRATGKTKGRARAQAQPPMVPPTQPTIPPEQLAAQFWMELAAEPGASPLIQEIAARASGG